MIQNLQNYKSGVYLAVTSLAHSYVAMSRSFTVLVEGSYSGLDTFPAAFTVLANALASHVDLADCHPLTVDISYMKVCSAAL